MSHTITLIEKRGKTTEQVQGFFLEVLQNETIKVDTLESKCFPDNIKYEPFNEEISSNGLDLVVSGEVDVYEGCILDGELTIDNIDINLYNDGDEISLTESERQTILNNLTFEEE